MQTKVDELIKQYPTVANTLGFVTSNLSVTETSPKVLAHNNTLAGPNSLTVQGKADGEVLSKKLVFI